jgi:mannose-1-phosphate guanylyltransferase
MCTGYRAADIQDVVGDGSRWDVHVDYSTETIPLGTGGAVKLARPLLSECSEFLVLNGDSFVEIDFQRLLLFHRQRGGIASLAVVRLENVMRYGIVQTERNDRVTGFSEKVASEPRGLINAGVYVLTPTVLDLIPDGPCSLEKDIFPRLLTRGVYALEQHGIFIDIGTPEDYARAQKIVDHLFAAAGGANPDS